MRLLLNLAVSMVLVTLIAINVSSSPFLAQASGQDSESNCEDPKPSEDCQCCTDCGCWLCP